MIEVKDLTKVFKKKAAVDHLNFELNPGIYGLLGPNGAGKTSLIRCLTNLYKYQGDILCEGKSIVNNSAYMKSIGYLPQKFGAYRELTVEGNLRYMCEAKQICKSRQKEEITKVLALVNLEEERGKKAKHLSGGMMRRLGIAQALLGDPKVLIFDEPTAGLDPEERLRFKMMVGRLPKDKVVLVSTHIVEDIEALCKKIIILKDGKIKFDGTAESLKQIASGKTFECDSEKLARLNGNYFVERQFEDEDGDKVMYRFVANGVSDCKAVKAKIEDGYICVLEGI